MFLGKSESRKIYEGGVSVCTIFVSGLSFLSSVCACDNVYRIVFKNVSKALHKLRITLWFNGENG